MKRPKRKPRKPAVAGLSLAATQRSKQVYAKISSRARHANRTLAKALAERKHAVKIPHQTRFKPIVRKQTTAARIDRNVGWAGAPCEGYMQLRQMHDDKCIAWGELVPTSGLEFGDDVTIEVIVTVHARAKKSRKKCHNPWPAHRCRP